MLDTGRPTHRLAERFAAVTAEEAAALLGEVDRDADRYLEWERFNAAVRRIALRAVLGEAARDDDRVFDLLSKLMDEANGLPDRQSENYEPYRKRIEAYVADAEEGSIVGLFGDAPADAETDPAGQVTHWLFALGDTLAINAWRALALISTHPVQAAEVTGRAHRRRAQGRRPDRVRDHRSRLSRGLPRGRDAALSRRRRCCRARPCARSIGTAPRCRREPRC